MSRETVGDLVACAALRTPDELAVCDALGSELTWAQYDAASSRAARGLLALGLSRGERVLIVVDEHVSTAVLHAAGAKAALAVVPVSRRLSRDEIATIVGDSSPAAVVYHHDFAVDVHAALTGSHRRPVMIEVGDPADRLPGSLAWADLGAGESDEPFDAADPDDVFYVGYTSGTTGSPKAIVTTHRACRHGASAAAVTYGLPAYGTAIMTASMCFLAAAVAHFWSHVYVNSTVELLGGFDAARLVRRVEARQATFVFLPAPTVEPTLRLFQAGARHETLHTILLGGSGTTLALALEFAELAGDRVMNGYGLSETLGPIAVSRASQWGAHQDGGVLGVLGRAAPPAVVVVVGEDGKSVPHDGESVGEVWCRTPALMTGYQDNPEATAAAVTPDGWLRTGDLVTASADGVLVFRGRSKDMIVSGGMNVYAADVESVLNEHPSVRECAVVGAPHPRWVETVVAFVALAGEDHPDGVVEAELMQHCRMKLAHYKCPTRVIVMHALPHNTNGKIAKPLLRQQLQ